MRNKSRALALHIDAQHATLITVTGTAVFAMILVAAFVGERQQARQDLIMQELRGPVDSGDIGEKTR